MDGESGTDWESGRGQWARGRHTFELLGREVETQVQGAFFTHLLLCVLGTGSNPQR